MRILAGSEALVASGAAHGIAHSCAARAPHRSDRISIMYASLSWSTVHSLEPTVFSAEVCRIHGKIRHDTVVDSSSSSPGRAAPRRHKGTPEISTGGCSGDGA